MIRVLIADDHGIVRQGIRQLLANAGDFAILAEASNGWETVDKVRNVPVDLLILDISMPGPSGVELIKRVKNESPKTPVLILSMHGESQIAARALKAGAAGYVTKDSEPSVIVAAARKVAAGGRYLDAALAEKLVFEGVDGDLKPHEKLSQREYQVFLLIAQGRSVNDIAALLHLSAKTVSTHKTRLMQKMALSSTADIVRYALTHGLIA